MTLTLPFVRIFPGAPEPECSANDQLARAILHDHHPLMYVEIEREEDGRWIAEVPSIPGAMAYGVSKMEAIAKVEALVLRALADKLEHGEETPEVGEVFTVSA